MIKAIQISNIPKLLEIDYPLFVNNLKDLFPKFDFSQKISDDLINYIEQNLEKNNYQKSEKFSKKIIQLYETQTQRHGVMILGPASVGKSKIISILQESLNQKFKTEGKDKSVEILEFFPKAVNLNDLFGYNNPLTNEWNNGILSNCIIDQVEQPLNVLKWFVLDG